MAVWQHVSDIFSLSQKTDRSSSLLANGAVFRIGSLNFITRGGGGGNFAEGGGEGRGSEILSFWIGYIVGFIDNSSLLWLWLTRRRHLRGRRLGRHGFWKVVDHAKSEIIPHRSLLETRFPSRNICVIMQTSLQKSIHDIENSNIQ